MKDMGKRSLEWDLNGLNWDGDCLQVNPINPAPFDSSHQIFPLIPELQDSAIANVSHEIPSCSKETDPINENETRELEKKRRIVGVPNDNEELDDEVGLLNLNLGQQLFPIVEVEHDRGNETRELEKKRRIVGVPNDNEELDDEVGLHNLNLGQQLFPIVEVEHDRGNGKRGKKGKKIGNSLPSCKAKGCTSDLRSDSFYRRRHKVCEMHAKSSEVLVGNVLQRFCQQCSRFHVLQAFDGDKKSCRIRLANHNRRRRRKNQAETSPNVNPLADETTSSQILSNFVEKLLNIYANDGDQAKIWDALSHTLQMISDRNTSGILQGSQSSLNAGTFNGIPKKDHSGNQQPKLLQATSGAIPTKGSVQETVEQKQVLGGIDLNNVYNEDSQDFVDDLANGNGSVSRTYWAEQTSPSVPPTSGNSASTSGRSSSSSREAQCRTDRIILKLFDKNPNDIPHGLRSQILDWLSHSPTDIEGFIRPGCIVLTLYLRLNTSLWEQFCYDIGSSLIRLLNVSHDPFWNTGLIYTRIQQRTALVYDGQVILDTPLPVKNPTSQILSISPIALPAGETLQLVVRGSNLHGPASRLLCAIEGMYLVQENCFSLVEGSDMAAEQDEIQSLSFSCSIPNNVIGRGFIEVGDNDLTGCFFPFIVAEPEVCYEICMLEREMEMVYPNMGTEGEDVKYQALDFVHEIGWLLHKNRVRFKEIQSGSPLHLFSFVRLKWLVDFSINHDWCAVLRKLIDLLFSGIVDIAGFASIEDALSDMALLHTAVRKNSRPMVEFLLRYVPKKVGNTSIPEHKHSGYGTPSRMLFRPDMAGIGGLTPLHVAASSSGLENVLEALLEDPEMVGIEAWKNARDNTGLTPFDYASLRGHYHYLRLVHRKLNKKSADKHVVFNIPCEYATDKLKSVKFDSFYTEKPEFDQSCKLCEQMPGYPFGRAPLTFRPVVISLVAIAVVCVCTALLFKSGPQISGIFRPFRWESMKYGAM